MLTIFGLILSTIFALLLWLYENKRELVAHDPETLLFRIFAIFDDVLVAITNFKLKRETQEEDNSSYVTSMHNSLNIDDVIDIQDSLVISIDVKKRIAIKELNFILQMLLMLPMILTGIIMFFIFISNLSDKYALPLMLFVFIIGYIYSNIHRLKLFKDNIMTDLIFISSRLTPYINIITINNKYISTRSSWGNYILETKNVISFSYKVEGVRNRLYINTENSKSLIVSYPSFANDWVLSPEELELLTNTLNSNLNKFKMVNA